MKPVLGPDQELLEPVVEDLGQAPPLPLGPRPSPGLGGHVPQLVGSVGERLLGKHATTHLVLKRIDGSGQVRRPFPDLPFQFVVGLAQGFLRLCSLQFVRGECHESEDRLRQTRVGQGFSPDDGDQADRFAVIPDRPWCRYNCRPSFPEGPWPSGNNPTPVGKQQTRFPTTAPHGVSFRAYWTLSRNDPLSYMATVWTLRPSPSKAIYADKVHVQALGEVFRE